MKYGVIKTIYPNHRVRYYLGCRKKWYSKWRRVNEIRTYGLLPTTIRESMTVDIDGYCWFDSPAIALTAAEEMQNNVPIKEYVEL